MGPQLPTPPPQCHTPPLRHYEKSGFPCSKIVLFHLLSDFIFLETTDKLLPLSVNCYIYNFPKTYTENFLVRIFNFR